MGLNKYLVIRPDICWVITVWSITITNFSKMLLVVSDNQWSTSLCLVFILKIICFDAAKPVVRHEKLSLGVALVQIYLGVALEQISLDA